MRTRQEKGREAEEAARRFLEEKGLVITARNVRCSIGELDLIARDGRTIVFVEVRSKSGRSFGTPQESITVAKQRKLTLLARWYLARHGLDRHPARFDVVAVSWVGSEPQITWIPNAFDARE